MGRKVPAMSSPSLKDLEELISKAPPGSAAAIADLLKALPMGGAELLNARIRLEALIARAIIHSPAPKFGE